MISTIGTAIVANGVVRKYGIPYMDSDSVMDSLYVYAGRNSMAIIRHATDADDLGGKDRYFFGDFDKNLNSVYMNSFGGLREADIWVSHPREREIALEIEKYSSILSSIKLPTDLQDRMIENGSRKSGEVYEPLDKWADDFSREFGNYLKNDSTVFM